MSQLVRLSIAVFCALSCVHAVQAETKYSMFVAAVKPANVSTSHPAAYVDVSTAAWSKALLAERDGNALSMSLPLPDGDVITLDVMRFSVVDPSTPLFELSEGKARQLQMPGSLLLRGKIRGNANSHVMLALFKTWSTGYITLEKDGRKRRYLLSPLTKAPYGVHIVNEDVYATNPGPWDCATVDTDFPAGDKGGKGGQQEQTQAINKIIRVAVEGDVEYYNDHNQDVYRCAEYAQAVVGASSDIYQRDISAQISTPWMGFWVTTDPYTGTTSSNILSQFRAYWLSNRTGVDRSCATLLSGVNGIGGVANLDALCTTNGYAVSGTNNNYTYPVAGYVWDTDVFSHELGHNVGSRHTHSCTWAPPIDSCYAAEGTCYAGTKAKLGTIMSYCHLTASGTELVFHSRVSAYMVTRLNARTCVLAPSTMTAGAGNDTSICTGVSITLGGTVSGGTGPYTYFWTPLVGITNPNTATPIVNPTEDITYVLEVRDAAGKLAIDSVKVSVGPPLTVTIPTSVTVCSETEVTITATPDLGVGAYAYTWRYDDITVHTTEPVLRFTPLFADTIVVYVYATDSRDLCDAVDSTIVIVNRKPYASITGPTVACRGELITLNTNLTNGQAPYTTAWTINGVPKLLANDDVLLKVDSTLNIMLVATDVKGCADTTTHLVTMRDMTGTVTPTIVQLPAIPPCADTATARVVFKNTGVLPLTIIESSAQVLSRPLPRTIAPGETDTFDVHFLNLPTGNFTDTLKFTEGTCMRVFKTVVKGQRNGVRIVTPLPLVVGPFIACDDSNHVDYTFTIANDAGVAVTLNTPEGPILVPALTDTMIRRTVSDVFTDTLTLDTLNITFSSASCEGSLKLPMRIRSASAVLEKPEAITFGSVFNDVATPVSQPLVLKATTGSIPFLVVDSIDIAPPFSSSLKKGQRLNNGVTLNQTVSFAPMQAAELGEVRDTMRIVFVGCEESYQVPLHALVLVTGVSFDAGDLVGLHVAVEDGTLVVRQTDASDVSAEVLDLQGRRMAEASGQGTLTLDASTFASGVYAVRVTTRQGAALRMVLITR